MWNTEQPLKLQAKKKFRVYFDRVTPCYVDIVADDEYDAENEFYLGHYSVDAIELDDICNRSQEYDFRLVEELK